MGTCNFDYAVNFRPGREENKTKIRLLHRNGIDSNHLIEETVPSRRYR